MREILTHHGVELDAVLTEAGDRVVEVEQVLRRNDQPGDIWESYEPTGEVIVRVRD